MSEAKRKRALLKAKLQGSLFDTPPPDSAYVTFTVTEPSYRFIAGGVPLLVTGNPPDIIASTFAAFLKGKLLPRFVAARRGWGNCHNVVKALFCDLQDLDALHLFKFKCGTSAPLRSAYDPDGLHAWMESGPWVFDGSNGADGRPVFVMKVEDFYRQLQLTDVRDIAAELAP